MFLLLSFQKLLKASRPTVEWGPARIEHRRQVHYVPGFVVNPWPERYQIPNQEDSVPFKDIELT